MLCSHQLWTLCRGSAGLSQLPFSADLTEPLRGGVNPSAAQHPLSAPCFRGFAVQLVQCLCSVRGGSQLRELLPSSVSTRMEPCDECAGALNHHLLRDMPTGTGGENSLWISSWDVVLPHFGRENKLPLSGFMVDPVYTGCKSALTEAVHPDSVLRLSSGVGESKLSPCHAGCCGGSLGEGTMCVSHSASNISPIPNSSVLCRCVCAVPSPLLALLWGGKCDVLLSLHPFRFWEGFTSINVCSIRKRT